MPTKSSPSSRIFKYTGYDTYAGFSNFFRYKLLLDRGGWWVDADTICLRPFDFREPFVFASVMIPAGSDGGCVPAVAPGIIKAPRGQRNHAIGLRLLR